jgi:ligand-binding SRPBCC domain-containing protein
VSFYSLKTEQNLPISLQEAWDFFSSPKNLSKITPKHMGFIITNQPSETMFEGQIITYKVSPLLGVKINWMTEITTVKDNEYFIDEQRFGPYSLWHHRHHFYEIDGGIKMIDEVNYKLPFGFLGSVAHLLFVRKKLKSIFEYREKVLIEMFGQF